MMEAELLHGLRKYSDYLLIWWVVDFFCTNFFILLFLTKSYSRPYWFLFCCLWTFKIVLVLRLTSRRSLFFIIFIQKIQTEETYNMQFFVVIIFFVRNLFINWPGCGKLLFRKTKNNLCIANFVHWYTHTTTPNTFSNKNEKISK